MKRALEFCTDNSKTLQSYISWSSACPTVVHTVGGGGWGVRGYTEYITVLKDRRSNPDRRQICFSSPKYSDRLQSPKGLLFIGHRSPFPGVKRPEREV